MTRFALAVLGPYMSELSVTPTLVNSEPGLALYRDGKLMAVLSVETDGARILEVFSVLNPDKLRFVHASLPR